MRGSLVLAFAAVVAALAPLVSAETMSLAGPWQVRLDTAENVGLRERWYAKPLADAQPIAIPGTLDQAGIGPAQPFTPGRLNRPHAHVGPAWYQTTIDVPQQWVQRRLSLYIERAMWRTQVWLDDDLLGDCDSLNTPHVYDLGVLRPGKHRLTVRVDNSLIHPISTMGHSYTHETQSIWNGMVGRVEVTAHDTIYIQRIDVFPDAANRKVRVVAHLFNGVMFPATGVLDAAVFGPFKPGAARPNKPVAKKRAFIDVPPVGGPVEVTVDLPDNPAPWDEFEPNLYEAYASISVSASDVSSNEGARATFGFRSLGHDGRHILVNGRKIFLRGEVDCCVWPITGHPGMSVDDWRRLLGVYKSHGLNHVRFHTWTPPRAAFIAADELGMYLQAEVLWLDTWMIHRMPGTVTAAAGKDPKVLDYVSRESRRVIEAYGNHPSFVMFCIGNELSGADINALDDVTEQLKMEYPRHLYAVTTARAISPHDDYVVTPKLPGGPDTRGLRGPTTDWDFTKNVEPAKLPVIQHEIGQWPVYVEWDVELPRYTGVLKPTNLEALREVARKNGILHRAADFRRASGAFSALLYKAEIEAALRSPNLAGIQLLGLKDFPGQGEALVGAVDVFNESKGVLEPSRMRRYFAPVVPLLRFPRYTWLSGETLRATAQVASYDRADLQDAVVVWRVECGQVVLASGRFGPMKISTGGVTDAGVVEFPLDAVREAAPLRVVVGIDGTGIENDWSLWVYPADAPVAQPDGERVTLHERYDDAARADLAGGKTVVLFTARNQPRATQGSAFMPVYGSLVRFPGQQKTLGICCDPHHPALRGFPTEGHADWQWHELLENSRALVLNDTPAELRPIVEVVDAFHRNNKLGYVFEARVGKGRLLVCSLDVVNDLDNRPVARRLRSSLIAYAQSGRMDPAVRFDPRAVARLLAVPESPDH